MKKFDDKINLAILQQLRQNSRISWQALGKAVHLSGQATAERVKQMQENGIINGFTIREKRTRHFIGMMMKHTDFATFETWLHNQTNVESVAKTSGDICYMIVYATENLEELDNFLNALLPHGSYRLNSSIRQIK